MLTIKIVIFIAALLVGIESASFVRYHSTSLSEELRSARKPFDHVGHGGISQEPSKGIPSSDGQSGACGLNRTVEPPSRGKLTSSLLIISKEKAEYNEVARTNGTQGTVTLRVTFLASGGIGAITVIRSLPGGLTENAIAAARKIKFEPEYRDGVPRTTTRPVSYTFNIY